MAEKLTTYDPAAALIDDEEISFFVADALETCDAGYIAKALGVVARAKDIAIRRQLEQLEKTGFPRARE